MNWAPWRAINRMGERLQSLIGSQRQLLRRRVPRTALAVGACASPWPWPSAPNRKRGRRCGRAWNRNAHRLEALIGEILALARLDAEPGASQRIALLPLLQRLREDALLLAPSRISAWKWRLGIDGWPDMFERAVDNLLRNAVRFNPAGQPLEVRASSAGDYLRLSVRDHGPGIAVELQEQLGELFAHQPEQPGTRPGPGHRPPRHRAPRRAPAPGQPSRRRPHRHPQPGPLRRKATE